MLSSSLHAEDHCARLRWQVRVYQVRELTGLSEIFVLSSYSPDLTGKFGSSGKHRDPLLKSDATHAIEFVPEFRARHCP